MKHKTIMSLLRASADSIRKNTGTEGSIIGDDIPEKILNIRNPTYEGSYSVTPKTTMQTLHTKDLTMNDDLEVLAIPYYEVSSISGGKTVYIGE